MEQTEPKHSKDVKLDRYHRCLGLLIVSLLVLSLATAVLLMYPVDEHVEVVVAAMGIWSTATVLIVTKMMFGPATAETTDATTEATEATEATTEATDATTEATEATAEEQAKSEEV